MIGKLHSLTLLMLFFTAYAFCQKPSNHGFKFEQLGSILPSANEYRNMDGSPGPDYWQQRCDYKINVS